MKEALNKIIPISAAILKSCIAVDGIVFTQQVYCSVIVDACIPKLNRTSGSYTIGNSRVTSRLQNRNNKLQSFIC